MRMLSTVGCRWLAALVVQGLVACGGGGGGGGGTEVPAPASPPAITGQPAAAAVVEGASASFTVIASGDAPLGYQWRRNGAAIAGATSANYTTPSTSATDNGASFTVVVSNGAGSVTSNPATLTVTAAVAVTIVDQPGSVSASVGSSATFSVRATASDGANLGYQWLRGGAAITGATSASYTTPVLAAGDDGARFSVRISAGSVSVTSQEAVLTVSAAAQAGTAPRLSVNLLTSMAVSANGQVLIWGQDTVYRLLGNGAAVAGSDARRMDLTGATVSAGTSSSLAVGRDGQVYGWGTNVNGELGDGAVNQTVLAPRALAGMAGSRAAVAGDAFTYALKNDGTVWHLPGVLTLGGSGYTSTPRQVAGLSGVASLVRVPGNFSPLYAIRSDGSVWALSWTQQRDGFVFTYDVRAEAVAGLANVVSAACTSNHCLFALSDGQVVARGRNPDGQLGDGSTTDSLNTLVRVTGLSGVQAVAVVGQASAALDASGRLWVWGQADNNGQPRLVPVALPGVNDVAEIAGRFGVAGILFRRADGSVWRWQLDEAAPVQVSGISLN